MDTDCESTAMMGKGPPCPTGPNASRATVALARVSFNGPKHGWRSPRRRYPASSGRPGEVVRRRSQHVGRRLALAHALQYISGVETPPWQRLIAPLYSQRHHGNIGIVAAAPPGIARAVGDYSDVRLEYLFYRDDIVVERLPAVDELYFRVLVALSTLSRKDRASSSLRSPPQ